MARKSPIQRHHIRYGNNVHQDEWVMPLKMWMHKAVTLLARMNPTEENYMYAINFLHAVMQVVNDHRMALDQEKPKHASQLRPKD